jgi:O-methyltransferase involved in polyketide biosynthesis
MNNVNKTLYIPLYGKAHVSKRGLFIKDEWAEKIWEAEGFKLRGKSKSKWLAYYIGIRAAVFDEWVRENSSRMADAVIIHIGCGMDSRAQRLDAENLENKWYDLDFPQVINERRRYFTESDNYIMLPCNACDGKWLAGIRESRRAIVVMEGVSMYMRPEELNTLRDNLCAHFEEIALLMDCYGVMAAKLSKIRNPINDVGVTSVCGIDEPRSLEKGSFLFLKEHNMTPDKYTDLLQGAEKAIFKKLYAGGLSKKLYRLFEYKKVNSQKPNIRK